jgi:hypothetical protein
MTSEEWLTSPEPVSMLAFLAARGPLSARKCQLLLCAVARLALPGRPAEVAELVSAAEDWATVTVKSPHWELSSREEALEFRHREDRLASLMLRASHAWKAHEDRRVLNLLRGIHHLHTADRVVGAVEACGATAFADLLRELFGDATRKVWRVGPDVARRVGAWPAEQRPRDLLFVRDWPRWQNGLPLKLAQSIEATRAWDRLPYLGDAMEEAGCDDEAILSHLRSSGPHSVGCWALDLILGKE